MTTADKPQMPPLPERQVEVPDYRGVEVGQPPRFRDPKNRRRHMGSTIHSYIDPDAPWGA